MTQITQTLADFLLARVNEIEAHVSAHREDAECCQECAAMSDSTESPITPARVLAECAAKRAIVEAHENERQRKDIYNRGHDAGDLKTEQDLRSRLDANVRWRALDDTLRALASVYADHPNFDPAWR